MSPPSILASSIKRQLPSSASSFLPPRAQTDAGIGITVDYHAKSMGEQIAVACLLAVAVWNGVEMVPVTFITFKRYGGLYFWSMLVATFGILLFAVGFALHDFQLTESHLVPALITVTGWTPMVTGQSLVLYSRLHLLYLDTRALRMVLAMIIFNAVTMHIPTAVLGIGSNSGNPGPFLVPYSIYEKVQVTAFFAQECVISGLYLWKAVGFLGSHAQRRGGGAATGAEVRSILVHLIVVHCVVIALDVTILALEYLGLYVVQTAYKAFVYSVKLKCEVNILNRLVTFVRRTRQLDYNLRVTEQIQREWELTLSRTLGTEPADGSSAHRQGQGQGQGSARPSDCGGGGARDGADGARMGDQQGELPGEMPATLESARLFAAKRDVAVSCRPLKYIHS